MTAFESLSAGDFVNVWNDGIDPQAKLRKADASNIATKAHGFVKTAASEGDLVKFYESGVNANFSDLEIGRTYFLSDENAGEATLTVPTDSGHIAQAIGTALSKTELQVVISEQPVIRA